MKITLNELRKIVRSVLKEETLIKPKFQDFIEKFNNEPFFRPFIKKLYQEDFDLNSNWDQIFELTIDDLIELGLNKSDTQKVFAFLNGKNDFNTVEGRIDALFDRIKFDYSLFSDIEKIYQWIENSKTGIMNYRTDEFEDLPENLVRIYEKQYSNFTDDEFKAIYQGLKRIMDQK
jgi:hypothetical protein